MKKVTVLATLAFGLAANGLAAEFKGFVQDQMCAGQPSMKGDAACAKKCVKDGSPAVLVTPEGKIYKIANQKSIVDRTGETVTVVGNLKGDTITVDSVK